MCFSIFFEIINNIAKDMQRSGDMQSSGDVHSYNNQQHCHILFHKRAIDPHRLTHTLKKASGQVAGGHGDMPRHRNDKM
jgi:hypothetical protein